MDNQENEVSDSSSEDLSGNKAEDVSVKKKRWRLDVPEDCKPPLNDLANKLSLRSMGGAVPWILPSEPKLDALVDLTRELGYEKGGETVDSLLQVGSDNLLLSVSRERGFQDVAETLNWCVPNDTKRLVELTEELGFRNGAATLNCLLSNVTRPMLEQLKRIAAVKNTPPTFSSDMNTPAEFPPVQFETPTFRRVGGAPEPTCSSQQQSFITNSEPAAVKNTRAEFPPVQFETPTYRRVGEAPEPSCSSQQQSFMLTNSEPAALGHSAGNHSVARHPLPEPIPEELNADQGFQNSWLAGMESEIQVQNNRIVLRETSQQNYWIHQGYPDVPGNPDIHHLIPEQSEVGISDWKQYENQGGTQMGGTHERHSVARHPLPEPIPEELNADQGFQNSWLAGMESEILVQNNRIVLRETSQQNDWIHQGYPDVPGNPDIHHLIPEQSEVGVSDWKQYENQGGTQMGGTHERHRGSSSKEEQNKFVADKAPKRS